MFLVELYTNVPEAHAKGFVASEFSLIEPILTHFELLQTEPNSHILFSGKKYLE